MTKPYPFQKEGILTIREKRGRVLLADEMGLGKTLQALIYAKRNLSVKLTVVVCPASIKYLWRTQAHEHIGYDSLILSGKKLPASNPLLVNQLPIIIINYDILKTWADYIIEAGPDLLVVDECHFVKTPGRQRTKAVRKLARYCRRMIAISGTPMTNRPSEMYQIINMLWPKEFTMFTKYAFRYCAPKRTPWGWDFKGASHLKELHEKLLGLGMIRRKKTDVLKDLPLKSRFVLPLPIKDDKKYKAIEADVLAYLAKTDPDKVEKAERAQQLVRMNLLRRTAAEEKLESLLEWVDNYLEETDQKIVLMGWHQDVIKQTIARYKGTVVSIHGQTPVNKRHTIATKFQDDPKIRVFVGNMLAAGVGINLYAADTLAFLEYDFVPGNHLQAEDRIHRIGQRRPVNIWYPYGIETIEEDMCRIIQSKQIISADVLDGKGGNRTELNVYNLLEKAIRSRNNGKTSTRKNSFVSNNQ